MADSEYRTPQDFENYNRQKKVERLASACASRDLWDDDPIWNESPLQIERMWNSIAAAAGVTAPSMETRRQTLRRLRDYKLATR